MRRGRRPAAAGAVLLATLLSGCGDGAQPTAGGTTSAGDPTRVATSSVRELLPAFDRDGAIEAYGELLASSAVTGGDALERTLAMTAEDRGRFDPECAPTWSHRLLDAARSSGTLRVSAGGDTLRVGPVEVPIRIEHERVVHQVGVACEGRLPHPERKTEETNQPLDEGAASTTTPSPTPTPSAPQPNPAPEPAPTPAPPASPVPLTEEELLAAYDDHLTTWSTEVFVPMFDVITGTQAYFGAVGGGETAQQVYEAAHYGITEAAREWSTIVPPTPRKDAHEALVDGLQLWALELESLGLCALDPEWAPCATEPASLRERWQERFATVTALTGVAMPEDDPAVPREVTPDPTVPPLPSGGFNIGDIRLPSEYEVRRSLG